MNQRCFYLLGVGFCIGLLPVAAIAQQDRIVGRIDSLRVVTLPGSAQPQAQPEYDRGSIDPSFMLARISLAATISPGQQAGLEELLREQQIPASPNYHRWLTPEQFGDRFGLNRSDIARIAAWLESEGFQVEETARARNWIAFSGTAGQVARTFRTQIHRYETAGETHFANSSEVSIPASLKGVIGGIYGLNNFYPKPKDGAHATTTIGSHAMTPSDFATIYDVNPLYAAGIDGTGVNIAIMGLSEITLSDYQSFRKMFNLSAVDPQMVLVGPSPGTVQGWDGEGLLDLEWAGAVAPNANLFFVYGTNIATAVQAAIDRSVGQIVSTSYAVCEPENNQLYRGLAQQANAQGITWLASSGDAGAAGCDYTTAPAQHGLAVAWPAAFPEVTGVGATQFNGDVSAYWTPSSGATGYAAVSYIPETSWNESIATYPAASGGGASIQFPKPDWQNGPGVPDDGARDVPDISLVGAIHTYETYWNGPSGTGGGTSASAPAFAGLVALLNQYVVANGFQSQPGLGNINPALYKLAQTVPSAFHDITTGDNIVSCTGGRGCVAGYLGYSAGPGYDQVTGLGSVDAYALITNWSKQGAATSGAETVTTLAVNPGSVTLGDTVRLTATVSAKAGNNLIPAGTVTFTSGATMLGTAALTRVGAVAIAILDADGSQLRAGTDTLIAAYSGNSGFNSSDGSARISVALPSGLQGSFVSVSVSPNPAYAGAPITFAVTEEAGTATTLTTLTMDGTDISAELPLMFGNVNLAAFGTLSASGQAPSPETLPATVNAVLGGMDTDGRQWSRQIKLRIVAREQWPAMVLSVAQATVQQDTTALDSSCQWLVPLLVEERNGFPVQLSSLSRAGAFASEQIDQLFGTSHLAPYGFLQAALCENALSPPQTIDYVLQGTDANGVAVQAALRVSFTGPASGPAAFAASPQSVALTISNSSGSATGSVAVSAPWTVSVFPYNVATSWLTVSPLSGPAPGNLSITANGSGLASGVYRATLILNGTNTLPQSLEVPVTLLVGDTSSIRIDGVVNAASFQTALAPGMLASVFGSQLASQPQQAAAIPLPLQAQGVSVTVNGIAAPLDYLSPGQLNIQIPYEVGAGAAVLGVSVNGLVAYYDFGVMPSAPGIFASGGALVPASQARPGDTLALFMTGEGDVTPFFGTNSTPPPATALDQLPKPALPISVSVGGTQAAIQFIGIPSGLMVTQINFTVPPGTPPGLQPVSVTVNGVASPPVNLTIAP